MALSFFIKYRQQRYIVSRIYFLAQTPKTSLVSPKIWCWRHTRYNGNGDCSACNQFQSVETLYHSLCISGICFACYIDSWLQYLENVSEN